MLFKSQIGTDVYIEKAVQDVLDTKLKDIEDDNDLLIVIFGDEGTGKSKLSRQIGSYLSYKQNLPFGVENIHFNTEDYKHFSENKPKGTVNILDESRSDLNRSSSTSNKAKLFTNWLSENRDLNQVHIILLPAFSDLNSYVALHRMKLLIQVGTIVNKDTKRKERGFYRVLKHRLKSKLLYIWKNKYSKIPQSMVALKGKFTNVEVVDEIEYKKKKKSKREDKYTEIDNKKKVIPSNLTQTNINTIVEGLNLLKKSYHSNSKEYKRCEMAIKRVISLEEGRNASTPLN